MDREAAQEGVRQTAFKLAVGAQALEANLRLLSAPGELYQQSHDDVRRQLSEFIFERLFIHEDGVGRAETTPRIQELDDAEAAYRSTLEG